MNAISNKIKTYIKIKREFKKMFEGDVSRYEQPMDRYCRHIHYYLRKIQCFSRPRFLAKYYRIKYSKLLKKYGNEIPPSVICGKGLYLNHPYSITINKNSSIVGDNINIHKGVTIGQENRGKRKGSPTILSHVWIGVNATIVGKVTIGNDVLIAPNTYVNCDIPEHSVVFGNPCIIKHKENATEGYINRTV